MRKMKALISTIEPRETGYRVAQVEQDANIFDVAEGLFWVDCVDDVVADLFWFDPKDSTIKPVIVSTQQIVVHGAETL